MYLGRLYRNNNRIYPRSWKILALVVALVLSVVSFFAAREAEAQQPAQESPPKEASQQRVVVVTDGEVAQPVRHKPPPSETLPAEKPSRPPVDPVPPAPKPEPVPTTPKPEPTPQQFAVVIVNGEVNELDPASPRPMTDPEPATQEGDIGSTPGPSPYTWSAPNAEDVLPPAAPEPEPVLGPVASEPTPPAHEPVQWSAGPEPVASQGDGPVSPPTKEAPRVFEEAPSAATLASPLLGKGVAPDVPVKNESAYAAPIAPLPSPAVGHKPSAAPMAPSLPVPMQQAVPQPPSSLGAAVSAVNSAVDNIRSAAASVAADVLETLTGASSPVPSSDETQEGTSQQPASPLAPPMGGSSFSLAGGGGGQAGPGGGVAPLLVGVLASVLVLLRRDVRTWLVSCDLPKPSSALLLPLERPG